MTKAEAETELAMVKTAIERILTGGQSFQGEGRAYQRADLRTLYARQTQLETIIRRADGGGVAYAVPS